MFFTICVRCDSAEEGDESSALRLVVGHHVQHHRVAGGNHSAGPECSAKPTQFLQHFGVSVVHVQVVVPTEGIRFEIHDAERKHDHIALGDLIFAREKKDVITYEDISWRRAWAAPRRGLQVLQLPLEVA